MAKRNNNYEKTTSYRHFPTVTRLATTAYSFVLYKFTFAQKKKKNGISYNSIELI